VRSELSTHCMRHDTPPALNYRAAVPPSPKFSLVDAHPNEWEVNSSHQEVVDRHIPQPPKLDRRSDWVGGLVWVQVWGQ